MHKLKKIGQLTVVLLGVLLFGCGGGGGGSSDDSDKSSQDQITEGSIDADAEELAIAAKETSSQILASESDLAPIRGASASLSVVSILNDAVSGTVIDQPTQQVFRGASETDYEEETGECGGTLQKSCVTTTDDLNYFPYSEDCESVFDDYCEQSGEYEVIFNGTLTVLAEFTDSGTGVLEYGYDITYSSTLPFHPSGTLRYNQICYWNEGVQNCSTGVYKSESTTYTTSDVSVSGNTSDGYNVDYTISDSQGYSYYVEFADLVLCENGHIGSGGGTVTFNGSEELSIDFISCDEFKVTHNSVAETLAQ